MHGVAAPRGGNNEQDRQGLHARRQSARAERQRGRLRLHAPARHDAHLRQSGLHRAADVREPAGRLLIRPGPAGGERGGHGRRLCPDQRRRRVRQPALGRGPRPRAWQHLHRLPRPRAACDRDRPAIARAAAARSVPVQREPHRVPEALRQVGVRAGARRRRAGGHRQGLLHRHAAAARAHPGLGAALRLGGERSPAARARDHDHHRGRPRGARPARRQAQRLQGARDRGRPRGRHRRRLGCNGAPSRAAAGEGLGKPQVLARELPGAPSAVCRVPARGPARARAVPWGSGLRACARRSGVHLPLPQHRRAYPRRRRAVPDHRRSQAGGRGGRGLRDRLQFEAGGRGPRRAREAARHPHRAGAPQTGQREPELRHHQ